MGLGLEDRRAGQFSPRHVIPPSHRGVTKKVTNRGFGVNGQEADGADKAALLQYKSGGLSTNAACILVGPAGFEPTTSSPPVKRATKLRYGPTLNDLQQEVLLDETCVCDI